MTNRNGMKIIVNVSVYKQKRVKMVLFGMLVIVSVKKVRKQQN